ncbi:hypothetical protein FEP95_01804 [Burkholderia multivorans]|nr:hypothetical protein [Burkholderia multivorans]MDR8806743.1 hypothetical protein [Burkholderia multivorans]
MDRRCFDDDSPTLTVQAHGDSTVHTTRISATKSAPRQIDRLALTIKIHSDSSRSGTHLSTWINGSSTMTRRHSALGLPAIRSTTRCPSTQQKPRLGESLCGAHHRNSQQLESLPCSPIHMNKRQFDDDSRALSAPVPCGSIVHAMPVPTTKIRALANRPSHPHHRNSQRFESLRCRHIHIAEPIWTDSLVRTRYSGSQRLEPFRNGRLHNRKPCFAGSTASHSPSKFAAIRVPVPPTYPHPEPRFDGSLADGRRSASQQSRAFSQPTSAHRKPCLAMRLLSLTVATHSDPSVRTADISTSDAP